MNTPLRPTTIRPPFSTYVHGVAVPAGSRFVFASGQLGVGPDDVIPEDIESQTILCLENVKAVLAKAGMTLNDVVRFNAFVTDRSYFPIYGKIRDRYLNGGPVASTLVIVSGFSKPEFKIEVEVTAAKLD